METLPIEKKHGTCLQINRKVKFIKKKKKEIGEEQDGTKDSSTFFFFAGGLVFLFLN